MISEIRETDFMPRFRWRFAVHSPGDIKFRDCQFAASLCTHVNWLITEALTDDECQRLTTLISAEFSNDAIDAVELLAPLPEGIATLRKFMEVDR